MGLAVNDAEENYASLGPLTYMRQDLGHGRQTMADYSDPNGEKARGRRLVIVFLVSVRAHPPNPKPPLLRLRLQFPLSPLFESTRPRDSVPAMDALAGRLAAASVSDHPSSSAATTADGANADHLLHVMRAVEGAEATIRNQLEENNRLKEELMQKTRQLQRIREGAASQASSSGVAQDRRSFVATKMDASRSPASAASSDNSRTPSALHHNGAFESGEPSMQQTIRQNNALSNGASKRSSGEQPALDSAAVSQFSTPSSHSLSPTRHRKEGEHDPRLNLAGQGLLPASEMASNMSWKQDLTAKIKENEEEIAQLRKHLADYSLKAFDQQQQDLIDAASKALSYRQDIIEENIRLAYAVQAAQQERTTFISSLLPLLSEYENLQPSVLDAQSIVSNLKVLFKHLQEQLIITEEKLKESRYQITPWQTELANDTTLPVHSPTDPLGKALNKSNLDIVTQTPYPHIQSPMSSPVQVRGDWGVAGNKNRQVIPTDVPPRNVDHGDMGRSSLSSRRDVSAQVSQHDPLSVPLDFEPENQNPPFKRLSRSDVSDASEGAEVQHAREHSAHWGHGDSANLVSGIEDTNSSYPYLPTVLEEPGSSFSEAAEDDPLPGIEGLRITGEAFPGRELQASGFSTNGTTSCNFEWVRHLEDGSVNFIEGARQPNYLVTADDVDTLLAIEVQPLDDRKRKGEIVRFYANDQRKITCDPETKELIKRTLETGHVSYEVQLPVKFLDMWEPAILAIKREGYSIKCTGQRGVVLTEKFQQATSINIPYGRPTEFLITSADGVEYNLKPAENALPRDTIVLVLRLFRIMAVEKRRGRKKSLFFNDVCLAGHPRPRRRRRSRPNPRLVVSPLSLASPASPRRTTLSPLPRVPRLPSPLPPSDLPRTSRQRRPPHRGLGAVPTAGSGVSAGLIEAWPVLTNGVAAAAIITGTDLTESPLRREQPSRRQILLHRCPSANPYAPTAAISERLEDPESEDTKEFVASQAELAESVLAGCFDRENLRREVTRLFDHPRHGAPFRRGDKYFYFHNSGLQAQSVLYVQDSLDGEAEVLLDPNALSKDGTVALSTYSVSKDGKYIAYGLSERGSDWVTIRVMNIADKQTLSDKLSWVKFSSISWTHDGKGFFYGRYPAPREVELDAGTETNINLNHEIYYHVVGSDQSEDILCWKDPEHPKYSFGASVTEDGKYIILGTYEGCDPVNKLYYCEICTLPQGIEGFKETKGMLPFVKLIDNFDAQYHVVANDGDEFTFLTNRNAPKNKLVRVDIKKPELWTDILPEHERDVLESADAVNGNQLLRSPVDGKTWTCNLTSAIPEMKIFREISVPGFDRTNFEVKQIFVNSKDGTKIPMFIMSKRDIELDGSHPTLLYGYGGFNISLTPSFSVSRVVLCKNMGFVVCVANIRGGGEYGEQWHKAGARAMKQNCFDDFIACAELLISAGYTSYRQLCIEGGSNGGLLIAACVNQRPDLFGCALAHVGVMDMLRFHKFTIGHAWTTDYGCSDNEEEFHWLIKYSPLHNVRRPWEQSFVNCCQYPAIMLLTADHDDRVVPLHSLKLLATLQYVLCTSIEDTPQVNPIIGRIDIKSGHGAGRPTKKMIDEVADRYSFMANILDASWTE
uniref:prolyl oligopeptidase n=1 Tax=Oryza meridionalis TaxID=40149 RepID=A0A0E0BVV1_9ORYZ